MEAADKAPVELARREIVYSSTALRGLAMLAVIAIHVTDPIRTTAIHSEPCVAVAVVLLNSACWFAVPLFFVLSFFTLALNPIKPGRLRGFYRTKLPKLIGPYLVYSFLYSVLRSVAQHDRFSWLRLVKGVLYGSAYHHLWFIHALILLFVLHPFAWHFYRRHLAAKPISVACLAIIQVGMTWGISEILDGVDRVPDVWVRYWLRPLGDPVFQNWWYVLAGYALYDYADRIVAFVRRPVGRWAGILVSISAVGGITGYWISCLVAGATEDAIRRWTLALDIAQPILTSSLLPLLLASTRWTKGRLGVIMKSFGLYSYGVYLVHPALHLGIVVLLKRTLGITPTDPVYLVVCFALLPWTTLIVVRVLSRWSVGRFLT